MLAEDLRWMLALTGPRVKQFMRSSNLKLGLDDRTFARSVAAISGALSGHKHLTRTELGAALKHAGVDITGTQRLAHLVMDAELSGLICSGVLRGKKTTYALTDERIPAARVLDHDEALAELATRYFATRGPATVHDFSWWSGLTVADARKAVAMLATVLEKRDVDGRSYWSSADAAPPKPAKTAATAHLLPNYDEYFIGHKDRGAIQQLVRQSGVDVPPSTFLANVIIADGQLVGGWTRTFSVRSVSVELHLVLEPTSLQMRSIRQQAARYAEFLGLPLELHVD